jgi:cytochrome c-type biogenesis protein CcmH
MQPKRAPLFLTRISIAFILALFVAAGSLCAQETKLDPAMERQAEQIFLNTLSPYCPGRLLRDCPSNEAAELKEDVRKRIAAGESPEAIQESLFAQFGDEIRAAPPGSGFGLFAWIAPFAFLLAGFVFILLWLKSMQSQEEKNSDDKDEVDPEIRSRIDSELSKM